MSNPRHVLCSDIFHSFTSFPKDSGSSHFRGSDDCSGQKSAWMTNRDALVARFI